MNTFNKIVAVVGTLVPLAFKLMMLYIAGLLCVALTAALIPSITPYWPKIREVTVFIVIMMVIIKMIIAKKTTGDTPSP